MSTGAHHRVGLGTFGRFRRSGKSSLTFLRSDADRRARWGRQVLCRAVVQVPEIGILDDADARRALTAPAEEEGASWEDRALDRAVELTGGYPYFLQELGYAVWGIAEGPTISLADIEESLPLYESKLDSSFFRVRLDRATELQRAYLRAMAELGPEPQKASDVAEVLGRTSPQVAPTRAELIALGLLYTPEHGYAAFTVPHFDRFMLRAMPDLFIPPIKRRKG